MLNIRNVAIIAHVDHGKTTLVDALLRQSNTKMRKDSASELIMDSNELERERGITIFSKNAAVEWNGAKINIIDTPGHADFGGEVERVLKMADGCLLLVDAKEGPMPQTRFVLKKALEMNLKIIVVINKIDKPEARVNYALDKTFDLFVELGASDEATDFPVIYASAKKGLAGLEPNLAKMKNINPIFETILQQVPAPSGNPQAPLQMLVTSVFYDDFKGRIATGRIYNGNLSAKQEVMHINRKGQMTKARLTTLMIFQGLGRAETDEVQCGDILAIAGLPDINIGEETLNGFFEFGGGGPKNFIQQTGPIIQQILGIKHEGGDYGLQITTATERDGGLSGCTFGESHTWGKYKNSKNGLVQIWGEYSIIFPLIVNYIIEKCEKRKSMRLIDKNELFYNKLTKAYHKTH